MVEACISLIRFSSTNATAGFTPEQKEVSQQVLWPVYFQRLITVEEWAATLDKKV